MRYKIINIPERNNEEVHDRYFVMIEVKRWYHKEPKWKHLYEPDYAGRYKVSFYDLNKAEKYIRDMIKSDNTDLRPKEIKIYNTRENVIDNLLENE